MSVLGKLASALGRNDEQPNVELAEALAAKPDAAAIAELAGALATGTTAVSNDAIKVLYELGALKPELVAPHAPAFLKLLSGKNNRNVWGALQAIETITSLQPAAVLAQLPAILVAADKGSVIAKDKAVAILVKLAAAGHGSKVLPVLLERLDGAAPNQFPMYAEQAQPVIDAAHREAFVRLLETRLTSIEASAKRTRVEKVLRRARA
ncbi:hypothetical protein ASC89_00755 [Devosia sp. Root413D1]|jgi:hypothetical protein|uniref:hypothetical protein n=1 Tax=unclassified Devosia TaxID=196773 RepID=UPI0006F99354|nr:hypothetical protein [Devosia sp. Root413D1]KQW85645.1 hypothetical protein ASC89_00755 [Devosia sp. Root413D1]